MLFWLQTPLQAQQVGLSALSTEKQGHEISKRLAAFESKFFSSLSTQWRNRQNARLIYFKVFSLILWHWHEEVEEKMSIKTTFSWDAREIDEVGNVHWWLD